MPEYNREEWWLQVCSDPALTQRDDSSSSIQPHDLQEMQTRVLLGLYGYVYFLPGRRLLNFASSQDLGLITAHNGIAATGMTIKLR
jgi:hypothetical protein